MNPEDLVKNTEAAYQAQDADRIMELFDPEIVVYWDGKKLWETPTEVRENHDEAIATLPELEIQKSLRAASGDTITVEWTDTWVDAEDPRRGLRRRALDDERRPDARVTRLLRDVGGEPTAQRGADFLAHEPTNDR